MGWLDYHLHKFRVKKPRGRKLIEIGIPDTETDRSVLPGWDVPISTYFTEPGVSAAYDYDFGDGWRHEILLEGILIKDISVKYPVCVADPNGVKFWNPSKRLRMAFGEHE